jgi:predicted HAD superfamily Cof-like phosphohydrolase
MASNFDDVRAFHERFGVPVGTWPHLLNDEDFLFRLKFLKEELTELEIAHADEDLVRGLDRIVTTLGPERPPVPA